LHERFSIPDAGEQAVEARHGGELFAYFVFAWEQSTAGGLVFTGDAEGNFIAFDASNLKPLWHFQMGAAVYAPPIAFAIDGKEFVIIAAGSALYAFALP